MNLNFGGDDTEKRTVDEEMLNEFEEHLKHLINNVSKKTDENKERIKYLDQKCNDKIDKNQIESIQEKIINEAEKKNLKLLKKVAEKEELKVIMKHFDKLIKDLYQYIRNKFSLVDDNEEAMLSKKPVYNQKCASCDKTLRHLFP